MAQKLNSELAAFFETGDQPSETEFGHLIDTILPSPVVLTDSATVTLTKAANQGTINVVPDLSQASTYSIPTPAAAGESIATVIIFFLFFNLSLLRVFLKF